MSNNFKSVEELEKSLREKLEQSELFKQWISVQTTLSLLGKSNGVEENKNSLKDLPEEGLVIPKEYSEELSWRGKVLFVLSQIKGGFISDIIKELRKQGVTASDEFLNKRISTTASKLKTDGYLKGKKIGKQAKYFIN
jgi:hypothetical protein